MIDKPEGFLWCPKSDSFLHLTACRSRRATPRRCPVRCYVKKSLKEVKKNGPNGTKSS